MRCARGRILDVVVDLRRASPTYGEWEAHELDDERARQLYIPVGFAHGFCVLSDVADVTYKCSTYYDAAIERGFHYADPDVGDRVARRPGAARLRPRPARAAAGRASPASCRSERDGRVLATAAPRCRSSVAAVPFWLHSIDLGDGVVTPGHKPPAVLRAELDALALPDLHGKSVLDIGGWDGFFALRGRAARRGPRRRGRPLHVVDGLARPAGLLAPLPRRGRRPRGPITRPSSGIPTTLPGKRGFDLAREALGSAVEEIVADFMTCDLAALGQWDVVLYLGVLYHMEEPLTALRRLAAVTRERAVVETEAIVVPGLEHEALWRFFPGAELNGDVSNWWAPNLAGLLGGLRAAGFADAQPALGPPAALLAAPGGPHHYRLTAHAAK